MLRCTYTVDQAYKIQLYTFACLSADQSNHLQSCILNLNWQANYDPGTMWLLDSTWRFLFMTIQEMLGLFELAGLSCVTPFTVAEW